jgi:Leucine-rich repeat (LRR) protein
MGCSNSRQREGNYSSEGINNVSMMRFNKGLTKLHLCNNQIVDVSRLNLPPGLTELCLHNNQIVDISGLTLPPGLKYLDLHGNQITDVSCITKSFCPNLEILYLSLNPIPQAEVDRLREELSDCNITADRLKPAPEPEPE